MFGMGFALCIWQGEKKMKIKLETWRCECEVLGARNATRVLRRILAEQTYYCTSVIRSSKMTKNAQYIRIGAFLNMAAFHIRMEMREPFMLGADVTSFQKDIDILKEMQRKYEESD